MLPPAPGSIANEKRVGPVAALGGPVAAEARLKPEWVTGLAVVLGLLHGYLNGSAMSQAKMGALGLAGIVSTLFLTIALAAAMVVRPSGRRRERVGSWRGPR